jgi:glutamate dehydrogenase (NAD(P)+)
VLVLAALGEVVTEDDADRIRARVVVEGANHRVTPGADEILDDRGVVLPGDRELLRVGAEQPGHLRWELEDVNRRLDHRLTRAYQRCPRFQDDRGRRPRGGAPRLPLTAGAGRLPPGRGGG